MPKDTSHLRPMAATPKPPVYPEVAEALHSMRSIMGRTRLKSVLDLDIRFRVNRSRAGSVAAIAAIAIAAAVAAAIFASSVAHRIWKAEPTPAVAVIEPLTRKPADRPPVADASLASAKTPPEGSRIRTRRDHPRRFAYVHRRAGRRSRRRVHGRWSYDQALGRMLREDAIRTKALNEHELDRISGP